VCFEKTKKREEIERKKERKKGEKKERVVEERAQEKERSTLGGVNKGSLEIYFL